MKENSYNNKNQHYGVNMTVGQLLIRVVQGALVGGGAILPGISGGVLCVTFGIYQPMMALIAHPIRSFRIYYKLFIPFLIGWLAGFLGLARVVELLFEASSVLAVSLFVGLIAGTLPSLFRDAGRNGTTCGSWSGFAISLFILYAFLTFLQTGSSVSIDPNGWWYFFCGAVWGLSLVIPGLSSSSILIFMGLYQSMTAGIASLNIGVILPLLAGIIFTAAFSARLVNYLFEHYHSISSHIILGVVIASSLIIIPSGFNDIIILLLSLMCFTSGFAVAWLMDKYGEYIKKQQNSVIDEG